ncbi:MAG: phage major tail protein, TP901-1 family [Gammaproteobacteria bacterium]|nr:phage major tail protein, TP901-1 family [Gammaproteobacteria bacterium]
MTRQSGALMLIALEDQALPATYVTVLGLRTKSFSINNTAADVTNSESMVSGQREQLGVTAVKELSGSGAGTFTDAAAEQDLLDVSMQADPTANFQITIPAFATFTGAFLIDTLEYAGEYNGEATYNFAFSNSGVIVKADL